MEVLQQASNAGIEPGSEEIAVEEVAIESPALGEDQGGDMTGPAGNSGAAQGLAIMSEQLENLQRSQCANGKQRKPLACNPGRGELPFHA